MNRSGNSAAFPEQQRCILAQQETNSALFSSRVLQDDWNSSACLANCNIQDSASAFFMSQLVDLYISWFLKRCCYAILFGYKSVEMVCVEYTYVVKY